MKAERAIQQLHDNQAVMKQIKDEQADKIREIKNLREEARDMSINKTKYAVKFMLQ